MGSFKKEIIPGIFVFVVISIIALFYKSNEKNEFKNDGVITNALVTGFQYDYKGRLEIDFEFLAGNNKVNGVTAFPEFKGGAEKYLMNKHFPVIYLKQNVGKNHLLASIGEFKRFSIPLPDSLSWVKQLERIW